MREPAGCGVEHVHFVVVPAGEPQLPPVGAHVPHVGAPTARHRPRGDDPLRRGVEHRDTPRPVAAARCRIPAAVADVHAAAVPAGVNAVRALPGSDEPDAPERVGIHEVDAVRHHVGDVEHPPVRRRADVLGHRARAQAIGVEQQIADHPARGDIELQHLARKLARRKRVPPVGGELHVVHALALHRHRLDQGHRVRVAEVEPPEPLRHHDRPPAIGREVEVVRVGDRHARPFAPVHRVNRREGVPQIVCYPERREIVRRNHVLGQRARGKSAEHAVGQWIDDAHAAVLAVRHVDERDGALRRWTEHPRAGGSIQVRRHAVSGEPGLGGARRAGGDRQQRQRAVAHAHRHPSDKA